MSAFESVEAPQADPDKPCEHIDFRVVAEVNRITDGANEGAAVLGFSMDLRVWCANCEEPFRFNGVQAGLSPAEPRCSPDETELHVPIRPASADPDFGMGLPGFAIRVE